jgi:hypothetical protein
MRGNYGFIGNGYAEELIKKIYEGYAFKAYLSAYSIQSIRNSNNTLSFVSSLQRNTIYFKPLRNISFVTEMIEDSNIKDGDVRFENRYPILTVLTSQNKLDSNRLDVFTIITEQNEYLAI